MEELSLLKLACLTFTSSGEKLAEKVKASLKHEVDIFLRNGNVSKNTVGNKDQNEYGNTIENLSEEKAEVKYKAKNLKERFTEIFNSYEGIIFVSSTGIAVRYIAPLIKDKTTDPAVVVVDDLGRYSISLLSGHLGGANTLADEVAKAIDAMPIITTASDGRGIEAVDMFAKRMSLYIEDMKAAKVITAMMLDGKKIKTLWHKEVGDRALINAIDAANSIDAIDEIDVVDVVHLTRESHAIELIYELDELGEIDVIDGAIVITPYTIDVSKYRSIPLCILRPKVLNVGVGCRKGKSLASIKSAITDVFKNNNLSLNSIKAIATIDVKAEEEGIIALSKELGCELKIFSSEEVKTVQDNFAKSKFVHQSIGVTSVSEPCAYLAGGRIIVGKTPIDGVTIAVSLDEILFLINKIKT